MPDTFRYTSVSVSKQGSHDCKLQEILRRKHGIKFSILTKVIEKIAMEGCREDVQPTGSVVSQLGRCGSLVIINFKEIHFGFYWFTSYENERTNAKKLESTRRRKAN